MRDDLLDKTEAEAVVAEVERADLGFTAAVINGPQWDSYGVLVCDEAAVRGMEGQVYAYVSKADVEILRSDLEQEQYNRGFSFPSFPSPEMHVKRYLKGMI